jgi:NADPH2 dehydrogenase
MANPVPQFSHFVSELRTAHPTLAYLHVIEARVYNWADRTPAPHENNDFLREIWGSRPYISAGGHSRRTAEEAAEKGDCVAFGRWYISNVSDGYFNYISRKFMIIA